MLFWIRNRSNEELVQFCRDGVPEAWAELVRRYEGLVRSVPKRFRFDSDTSDDVAQFTFLQLYHNLDRLGSEHALSGWLSRVATNECIRLSRISARTSSFEDVDESLSAETDESEVAENMATTFFVREALDRIGDKCRELLTLLLLEQAPYTDISSRLDMPVGAIGPTRQRCLQRLRKQVESLGFRELDA